MLRFKLNHISKRGPWTWFVMYYRVDTLLYILLYAKHLSMCAGNDYLAWFRYTDVRILIDPFTTNPGYWQMYVEYILARNAS